MPQTLSGGRILVDELLIHGVRHVFCVPGESYLSVLDALHDSPIMLTVCRHEGGAAMMAEAHGKLTGQPGICMVTRGPGATNAASGLHVASQDSTPMILFVGQVERGVRGREAFQELDYRAVFGSIAKWVAEIDTPARIPELISRAFHIATNGRPGPVVIALPEDMLVEAAAVANGQRFTVVETTPGHAEMEMLQHLLDTANDPFAIVGGSRWSAESVRQFALFAERFSLPVACSFRRQMIFPADHPSYAGDLGIGPNPKLVDRLKKADLLMIVGGRLSEVPSQNYTLLDIPVPRQTVIHVHPDPDELGRVYHSKLAINASPVSFSADLAKLRSPATISWRANTAAAHSDYLSWSDPTAISLPGALQMGAIMTHLRTVLPADTVFCNGAGNFATWVHRFWPFRVYGTQLAPTAGSMGYGIPAAVAAQRMSPRSRVVAFCGDGDFLMTGQEFATAVQYELPILVILVDNGMYGTIRMHQEREYPGRVVATHLNNPDFAAYARAFGGFGERIERTEEFGPALDRAIASRKPSILHLVIDPEAITPALTLSQIRERAMSKPV
jgi:acetolactate synthase-1/2/3 large subunit